MKKDTDIFYRQCLLENGSFQHVAWIPEHFAARGRLLRVRGEEGWKVVAVWGRERADYLLRHERDYSDSFASLEGK